MPYSPVPVYSGRFGSAQAERLLWRAGFGARTGEAAALAKHGLTAAVKTLTVPASTVLVGPSPHDEKGFPLSPANVNGHDHLWWLDRMVRTEAPLIERMTLIWHDWFATSNLGVGQQQLMLNQNQLFRDNALGSFKRLLTSVTQDPAMLVWLNGNQNIKSRPNENYGRELMELFTLGADRGAYTETDVREQARALTGWRGSITKGVPSAFTYNINQHDSGTKTIFSHVGQWDWKDAGILCIQNPFHPSYFVAKLWSYFIPTPPSKSTLQALVVVYTKHARRIQPVIEAILMHPDFYLGPRMVKPPVVYTAGLMRMRGVYVTTTAWVSLGSSAGQRLFYPPDVSGWDDTRWLDTATYRARWQIAGLIQGSTPPSSSPKDPAKLVARARGYWASPGMTSTTMNLITAFARAQLKTNSAESVEFALRRLVATSPDLQTA